MASQTLLSLVARLQQGMSVAQGRAMLLEYARKSCGSRLALLFELNRQRQILALLEHSGRPPHPASFSPDSAPIELPLQGLFASALRHKGFVNIPDITRDSLSLPEERALAWSHGRVLLHALRQGRRQGVLAFCFSPAGPQTEPASEVQEELLICVSLLSAYLVREEEFQPVRRIPGLPEMLKRSAERSVYPKKARNGQKKELEAGAPLDLAEVLRLLTALCDLGLRAGAHMERQVLGEQILLLLCRTLYTSTGCLWRYQPAQRTFLLQASVGNPGLFAAHASAELDSLASTFAGTQEAPASGLIILPEDSEHVLLWHLLRYYDRILGALGVVLRQEPEPLPDQCLLLNAACDVVALILFYYDQRLSEGQQLIEQERARIAREMHDSIVQDVAYATQKLDYTLRILEKQPQAAINEINQARSLLNRSLRDLRTGISALLPAPLEEQEFGEALEALLREYSLNSSHLKITYDLDNLSLWPQALQAPVYRFMQEALNNIRKHADASEVNIRIHRTAGLGVVQISDNGRGFLLSEVQKSAPDHEAATRHMGLLTMEERIRQAGGTLEISSKPGEGTTLKARFPLASSSALLTEREREVLRLLVEGLTNRAISEHLSVSLETVKSHVHHIMQKMHVKDRTQAAVVATRQQWL